MSSAYQRAVKTLNSLQDQKKFHDRSKNPQMTEFFLIKSGTSFEQIRNLPVIHVGGTKGKGTTCCLCESILRKNGLKTGLFTSPHLTSVRERIKINGSSLTEDKFVDNFNFVYNKINGVNMPGYFKFLTVLAFKIFIEERVDVAIIEVGVGGEYDSTNFITNPKVVGITSLDIDHVNSLGNTLTEISWHKSGIFKPGSICFTVEQPLEALQIMKLRSEECKTVLNIVPGVESYDWGQFNLAKLGKVKILNSSLALHLAFAFITQNSSPFVSYKINDDIFQALMDCNCYGRMQVIKKKSIIYFLDGAHTQNSIQLCKTWFECQTGNMKGKRILIVNITHNHDFVQILKILQQINFDEVIFTTNFVNEKTTEDLNDLTHNFDEFVERSETHMREWVSNNNTDKNKIHLVKYIKDGLVLIDSLCDSENCECFVLVTGSFHLVGSVLSILDPQLQYPVTHTI